MSAASRLLLAALAAAALSPAAASAACSTADAEGGCRAAVVEEDAVTEALQLLQSKARRAEGLSQPALQSELQVREASSRDLAFVHVPCTFGHTVEEAALAVPPSFRTKQGMFASAAASSMGNVDQALAIMNGIKGPDGELWGMMHPKARALSNITGCNLYYTPGKYWPADVAQEVFTNKTLFALLRDPYDRITNDFRMQVLGFDSGFMGLTRAAVSAREGSNRESPEYQRFYQTCDVNGYVKAELEAVLRGDKFRANCHYLPQAEYYEAPFGATVPVDNRKIPESFNDLMSEHGYDSIRMGDTIHNVRCNEVSAYSLDEESKALVRQVYAADFALLCKHFGYCDQTELTCLEQIPQMCGSKPAAGAGAQAATAGQEATAAAAATAATAATAAPASA